MKLRRRQFLQQAGASIAFPGISRLAYALDYPIRSVRVIVPFVGGGATDIVGRLISQWLSERLHQPFSVENRPGGGTNIGTEVAVNSPPDGYTLLLASTSGAVNATLYQKLNFNLIRDLTPVAGLFRGPLVMQVNPTFQANSVPEFIAYAKVNPDKISMGSSGNGSSLHMSGELFKMRAGVSMVHVPYRGEAPALTDLIGGQVQVVFGSITASIEYIRAGTLRALAVTTATRSELLPNVQSMAEFLPGYDTSVWFGVCAPKNTPAEIIDKLNTEINLGLADSKMKNRFADLGGIALRGTPAEFGRFLVDETEKWGKVVRYSGARPD
jgi:tripartite-type tricarboxylate transporter receptor subunit TctC